MLDLSVLTHSDRFHDSFNTHAYCSAGFKCASHPNALGDTNTSQAEQKNAQLRKIGSAMVHMAVDNFLNTGMWSSFQRCIDPVRDFKRTEALEVS